MRDAEGADKLVTESNKNEKGYYLLLKQGDGTSVNNELNKKTVTSYNDLIGTK